MFNSIVTTIPNTPATKPSINVSALNIFETSFLEVPIALSIPISFVLSKTEIYVIIAIIMLDTISDIDTNAIKTYEIALIIVVTDFINSPTKSVNVILSSSSTVLLYSLIHSVIPSFASNVSAYI